MKINKRKVNGAQYHQQFSSYFNH